MAEKLYYSVADELVDDQSRQQMENAMSLPISVAGALMPDAHLGYGLPIGGVLATEGAVIPYAVGVDIACRMRMSVFPEAPIMIKQQVGRFEKALVEETRFGAGSSFDKYDRNDHAVMDAPEWELTRQLKSLKSKAYAQLGTSGGGNHFVEWGAFELPEHDQALGLEAGTYLALLSHSGSRGMGYSVANHYSDIAKNMHTLDDNVKHLGWLPLDKEIGQEYWMSMQLAGQYAAANHEVIHDRIAKMMGLKTAATIENYHNFAWKETLTDADGNEREVIVHRKGATPAGAGVMGIIPGSMGDAGYVVRGRGHDAAINSAAHGAGRKMSRRQAKKTITKSAQKKYLKQRGIQLIGGGLDEAPQAYKDIEDVIAAQKDLVDIVGTFEPRMVRMAD